MSLKFYSKQPNAGAKLPGHNETGIQLSRMTFTLCPVSLSDLFGLRSLSPLSPRAATQPSHPLNHATLRLTSNTTPVALKWSIQTATSGAPREISCT
jgi:hypothetical protein